MVVQLEFCGVCHSDIHTVRGEWGRSYYPIVPGHEIAGVVTEVGSEVTKHKVGDVDTGDTTTDFLVEHPDVLESAVYATEELEETARLYLLLRGNRLKILTPEQVAELIPL